MAKMTLRVRRMKYGPQPGAVARLARARNSSSQRRGFFNATTEAMSPWKGQDLNRTKVRETRGSGGGNPDQPRDDIGRWT